MKLFRINTFRQFGNSYNTSYLPHLIASTEEHGSVRDFLDRFMSLSSVQAYGWREGTVLDRLWQLYSQKGEKRALEAIKQHFDLFFDANKNLVYETSRSVPSDNRIDGIENAKKTIIYLLLSCHLYLNSYTGQQTGIFPKPTESYI